MLPYVPTSEVASRLRRARDLAADASVVTAIALLGNGTGLSAQDTVPFALWCAATHLADYEQALWLTASGFGDVDTTCAIVGSIVASYTGSAGIPQEWRDSREPLPYWPFHDDDDHTMTLYRPVGTKELERIATNGYRAFPPRLPEQPIFYPVLSEEYATQIAREWNARSDAGGNIGYVTRFAVRVSFLDRYRVQLAGNTGHQEYWIPAADLAEFNANIVGPIAVIAEYRGEEDASGE